MSYTYILSILLSLSGGVTSFTTLPSNTRASSFSSFPSFHHGSNILQLSLSSSSTTTTTTTTTTATIEELKIQIQNSISGTKRGLSVSSNNQKEEIDNLIQKLEKVCPLEEPARSTLMGGRWIVDYTTSPPPSNGKLGPFVGYARQIIDLEDGTYVNYLSVPGDIEKEWLSAKLEATFEEWDGTFLEDDRMTKGEAGDEGEDEIEAGDSITAEVEGKEETPKPMDFFSSLQSIFSGNNNSNNNNKSTKPDYGKDSWKVDFQSLTITAFGIPLITKKFENTSRIWKMSYLDENTRVVRAGRTGKDVDNMLFYMSRED